MYGAWKITSGASLCFYLVWESISLLFASPCTRQFGFWASRESSISVSSSESSISFSCFCHRNVGITDACYCAQVYVGPEVLKSGPWAWMADVSPVSHLSSPPLTVFFNHIFWNSNNSYFVFRYMGFNHLPCARVCVYVPVHACKSWRTTEGINLRNAIYIP